MIDAVLLLVSQRTVALGHEIVYLLFAGQDLDFMVDLTRCGMTLKHDLPRLRFNSYLSSPSQSDPPPVLNSL